MGVNVTVIGDGAWGTALALVLHENGHSVKVWGAFEENVAKTMSSGENSAYLPGVELPRDMEFFSDPSTAVADAEVLVLAVPSKFYAEVMRSFKDFVPAGAQLLSVTKGLDKDSHCRMTQLAESIFGTGPVAALSGPSFADEVARKIPTAVSIASPEVERARKLQYIFSNDWFRVYTSDDVVGTELGGALKNVVAIAAGVSDGIGFGHNSKAALITRGLAEIKRLGCALGARPETFFGMSGMGDLLLTCTGKLSRNRSVGERLGQGEQIDEIIASMKSVAEGVHNCSTARDLAMSKGVDVPITEEVYQIIRHKKNPRDAVRALLARELKPEE